VDLITRESWVSGHLVLSLAGEIDLATIPMLHDALVRAIASSSSARVFIDIDGVYVCDDTGLGVLLGAAGRARQAGGELFVVCSAGPLRERLAHTGFDRAVTVTSSVSEIALTSTDIDT
jgi:anti-sigma B factor antagonist